MSRIESLTPEQIARFAEFRDRWIRISTCTEPADRPRAEAAIRDMYRQGGLEPPAKIVWCGSPLSQELTRAIIFSEELFKKVGASVLASVRAGVEVRVRLERRLDNRWDGVEDGVWESVWASVRESVGAIGTSVWDSVVGSVRDSVGDNVRASVCDGLVASVRDSAGASVGDNVRDSVAASVRNSVWVYMGASVYGAHEAGWLASFRYFHDVVGLVDQTVKLSGLWELAQSAGWALPHQNICWISERHHILSLDDSGRLHCENGPACAYPDGWAIYAVHGVRVPRYVIEQPREIDIARIDAETNAEVRRVMIDRYCHGEEVSGAAAFMFDAGGERLDHDERFGTLWRRNVPDDEPIVMVELENATPEPDGRRKHYLLRVPPNMTTAHEAVAWSFNLPAKDYAPKVET